MSLRSSMYATMAIREFTRMDTGKTYQTKLTNQHQKDDGDKTAENADGSKEKILEDTLNSSETQCQQLACPFCAKILLATQFEKHVRKHQPITRTLK